MAAMSIGRAGLNEHILSHLLRPALPGPPSSAAIEVSATSVPLTRAHFEHAPRERERDIDREREGEGYVPANMLENIDGTLERRAVDRQYCPYITAPQWLESGTVCNALSLPTQHTAFSKPSPSTIKRQYNELHYNESP